MEDKKILFVAFAFPPFNSIGSRRWAKFVKNLARRGYKVYVIASENPHTAAGNWVEDVQHENIVKQYLPYRYPKAAKSTGKGLIERLRKKAILKLLQMKNKGNPADESILWSKSFAAAAEKLIREQQIDTVICSGPPFRANYYVCRLKEKFPQIHIISDFRDVWSDGGVYGLSSFSKDILSWEKKLEDYVFQQSAFLTYTDQYIIDKTIAANPQVPASKFVLLPHAYDSDDYKHINWSVEQNKNKIVFVFGGTLTTPSIEDVAVPLWKALVKLKQEKPTVYSKLKFIFYQTNSLFIKRMADFPVEDIFEIRKPVPETEFYNEIAKANYPVSILADRFKDYITTKNISYLPFKKPLVMLFNEGRATEMVRNNKLGYIITPQNCYEDLLQLINDHENGTTAFNMDYDTEQHSFERVTDLVEELIHNKYNVQQGSLKKNIG